MAAAQLLPLLTCAAFVALCASAGVPDIEGFLGKNEVYGGPFPKTTFEELSNPSINTKGYLKNKAYVYKYESQVLTGIPQADNQYAGIKVKATCIIEFQTDSHAILKLANVRFLHVNGAVANVALSPKWQVPESAFSSLSLDQEKAAAAALALPVKFNYNNGVVEGLEVVDGDAQWSVNIKKAVLNLLQVNINIKTSSLHLDTKIAPLTSEPITLGEATTNENVYRVMEDGVDGKCASIYKIHNPRAGSDLLHVTKVRDYSSCLDRKNYTKDTVEGHYCANDFQEEKLQNQLTMSSHAEFELIPAEQRNKFIIKTATLGSQHLFHGHTQQLADLQNFVGVYTNQTLKLVDEQHAATAQLAAAYETLKWKTVEQPLTLQLTPDVGETLELDSSEKLQKIESILKAIAAASRDLQMYEQHVPLFVQLTDVLKKCHLADLEAIWNQYALGTMSKSQNQQQSIPMKRERNALLDAMISIGADKVSQFLLDKIAKGEIEDVTTVWHILTSVNVNQRPSIARIEKLSALVDKFAKYGVERKAALLALGSLAHQFIRETHINGTVGRGDIQTADGIKMAVAKKLQTLLSTTTCPEEMMIVLRAIGNSGIDELLIDVAKIAQDKSGYPADVRAQAIRAMSRMSHAVNTKIQQTLLPLYASAAEESHVRLAAAELLLKKLPVSMGTLEFMVRTLPTVDIDAATLIINKMRAIATSATTANPCLQTMKRKIANALKVAKPQLASPNTGYHRIPLLNNEPTSSQVFLDVAYVGDHVSKVPKMAAIRIRGEGPKAHAALFSIGYKMHGVEKLARKPYTMSQAVNPTQRKQETINKLLNDEPRLSMATKIFGKTVAFKTIGLGQIKNLIGSMGAPASGVQIDVFKTVAFKPINYLIPTASGFPINMKVKTIGIADINGIVAALPASGGAAGIPNIVFTTSKPIRVELQLVGDVQVNAGIVKSGTVVVAKALQMLQSTQTTISFNAQQGAVNVKFAQPNDVMSYSKVASEPSTYAVPVTKKQWLQYGLEQQICKPVNNDLFSHRPFEFSLGADQSSAWGAQVNVRGELPVARQRQASATQQQTANAKRALLLQGRRKLSVRVMPVGSSNQDYEFIIARKTSAGGAAPNSFWSQVAGGLRSGAKRQIAANLQAFKTQPYGWPTTKASQFQSPYSRTWQAYAKKSGTAKLSPFHKIMINPYAHTGSLIQQAMMAQAGNIAGQGVANFAAPYRIPRQLRSTKGYAAILASPKLWQSSSSISSSSSSESSSSSSSSSSSFSKSSPSSSVSSQLFRSSSSSSSSAESFGLSAVDSANYPHGCKHVFIRGQRITGAAARRRCAKLIGATLSRRTILGTNGMSSSLASPSSVSSSSSSSSSSLSSSSLSSSKSSSLFSSASASSMLSSSASSSSSSSESSSISSQEQSIHQARRAWSLQKKQQQFGLRNIRSAYQAGKSAASQFSGHSYGTQAGVVKTDLLFAMIVHRQGTAKEASLQCTCLFNPTTGYINRFVQLHTGSADDGWKMQIVGSSPVNTLSGVSPAVGFGTHERLQATWTQRGQPKYQATYNSLTSTTPKLGSTCLRQNALGCKDLQGRHVPFVLNRTKVLDFGSQQVPRAVVQALQNVFAYYEETAQHSAQVKTQRSGQHHIALSYALKDEDKMDLTLQLPTGQFELKEVDAPWLTRILYWYNTASLPMSYQRALYHQQSSAAIQRAVLRLPAHGKYFGAAGATPYGNAANIF